MDEATSPEVGNLRKGRSLIHYESLLAVPCNGACLLLTIKTANKATIADESSIAVYIKKRQAKNLLGVDSAVVKLSRLNQHLADFQIYFDDAIGINTRITELSSVSFWARRAYRWNRRLHRVCFCRCCWFNNCFNRSSHSRFAVNNATFNDTVIHDSSARDRAVINRLTYCAVHDNSARDHATVNWLTDCASTTATALNWEALHWC